MKFKRTYYKNIKDGYYIYILDKMLGEVNKDRTELENQRHFTGEADSEELWTEVVTYIDAAYDLDTVKDIYISGGGAKWIKGGT